MKKKQAIKNILALSALIITLYAVAQAADPPEDQYTPIQRTQYTMSLIRGQFDPVDGDLVLISLPNVDDWVECFYEVHGPIVVNGKPVDYADLTAIQKGRFYLRCLRRHHIAVREAAKIPSAGESAEAAAAAQVVIDSEIFPEIEE